MVRRLRPAALAAIIATVAVGGAAGQQAERRAALVIGNGAYTGLSKQGNPVNDATGMAAALESLGFEVDLLTDASLPDMEQGVLRLGSRHAGAPDAVGLSYYAGHGVQSAGINHLIPADAQVSSEAFLKSKALAVQSVVDVLQGSGNRLNIVVLDACRDNPFGWARSGFRGLSVVSQQPPGSIVGYATSAGSVAQHGAGRNGCSRRSSSSTSQPPGST